MSKYSSGSTVPAGPFTAWLWDACLALGREEVRARTRLSGDSLQRLLDQGDDDTMFLSYVDVLLTRFDGPESVATLYPEDRTRGRKDRGRTYACDEQTLIRAHSMHMDGMSIRAVARELLAEGRAFAASEKSLTMSLSNAWRARGWEVRSQGEATAAANVSRGFRPQCSHIHRIGPRKGERCSRRCVGDDLTCWKHDEAGMARSIAKLRELDARRAA